MTVADVVNGLAVAGPEIPALVASLAVVTYRTTRALTHVTGTLPSTDRTHTT